MYLSDIIKEILIESFYKVAKITLSSVQKAFRVSYNIPNSVQIPQPGICPPQNGHNLLLQTCVLLPRPMLNCIHHQYCKYMSHDLISQILFFIIIPYLYPKYILHRYPQELPYSQFYPQHLVEGQPNSRSSANSN